MRTLLIALAATSALLAGCAPEVPKNPMEACASYGEVTQEIVPGAMQFACTGARFKAAREFYLAQHPSLEPSSAEPYYLTAENMFGAHQTDKVGGWVMKFSKRQ